MKAADVIRELNIFKNPTKARFLARYFKTGKGEYGQGDIFLGLTVPQEREIAKKYRDLPFKDIETLLHHKIHECRLTALLILVHKFIKAGEVERPKIVELYLTHTRYINNWDLVDLSSHEILGEYLLDKPKDRQILVSLAKSKSLWEKRIAMIATYTLLKKGQFADTFTIAEILLHDPHELIHKAVGWMLREVGKLDPAAEEAFLKKHYQTMPRITLRYAIERFSPARRALYLKR